ncbi:unknown protein [Parachlamydia acanthamoebae UV-7]|uniref:Uncharacterized protein n=2 Tax=Parachlamydia acanthamoebae TaxID=83552 RepID=F8KZD8_PARAV|nr:hypothetical protein DB43_FF00230 [Parachlamydia acanthamoebae]CCB86278.1 unknown protein [Parachlamydia acanthamoebae UV-7]
MEVLGIYRGILSFESLEFSHASLNAEVAISNKWLLIINPSPHLINKIIITRFFLLYGSSLIIILFYSLRRSDEGLVKGNQ